ncbi:hypothetical protein [Rhodoferax sp.]|uniref:hypothetical protein n=1 Tax=Rhodoferax sp. TaxID=50421 RepID=UPI0026329E22|nr:hypothetical protein [Rhodoferax sp.]MDD2808435.1 hypothetical protein [Rhodoferax sp.]MDD4944651.1 hypothetical protein [Rhodoferax sp.]
MTIPVSVTYKHAPKGQKPNTLTTQTVNAEAKSESAAMAALKKLYPTREIISMSLK